MTAKKTNINQKTVHIDQKVVKNVKKSQNKVKKDDILQKMQKTENKMYSEGQICKIACMVFMLESQIARLCAASGMFLGDELNKHEFLKEYMAVDRTMRRLSKDFHNEIEETIGKFRVFASDKNGVTEIKNGGAYADDQD